MQENGSEQSLKLFVVLSRAHKVISEKANKLFADYGLNPTEFAVLELLYHRGRQPIQKIGSKILLASGSMTYVIDKLQKRGYLKRTICESDRRVTFVDISEEGRKLLDEIFPVHEQHLHELMGVLSPEEKATSIELLKKLGLSIKDLSK
ncbi:MarR family winged helix-turn-helix transcriptional regulator [Bhargavaea beijingensis]|uniref:MarR family winged helix-turn-helix transcriptional regulator n=1 Tax=Bhargavaea beijingensis TaxID=426756 RepID=UPI002225B16B|nr:MarR family transcriptional regulator [Bhargavaea beijingensis]MCW1926766.1 MarR family transcriptional regulator [Bhargavaea beijingensis]